MISRQNRNKNALTTCTSIPTVKDQNDCDLIAEKQMSTKRSAGYLSDENELFTVRTAASTPLDLDNERCVCSNAFEPMEKISDQVLRVSNADQLKRNSSDQTVAAGKNMKSFADQLIENALTELTAALNRSLLEDNDSSPNYFMVSEMRHQSPASESSADTSSSAADKRVFVKNVSASKSHKRFAEKLIVEALTELTKALHQQMEVRASGRDSSVGIVPEETSDHVGSPLSDILVVKQSQKSCTAQDAASFNCRTMSVDKQTETALVEIEQETSYKDFSAESSKDCVSDIVPDNTNCNEIRLLTLSENNTTQTDHTIMREQAEEQSAAAARWRALVDKLVRPSAELLFDKVVGQIRQLRRVNPFAKSELCRPHTVAVSKSPPNRQNELNASSELVSAELPFSMEKASGCNDVSSFGTKRLRSSQSDSKILGKSCYDYPRLFDTAHEESNALPGSVLGTAPRISTSQTRWNAPSISAHKNLNRLPEFGMREKGSASFYNSAMDNKRLLDSQLSLSTRLKKSIKSLRLSAMRSVSGTISEYEILHQPSAFRAVEKPRVLPNIER